MFFYYFFDYVHQAIIKNKKIIKRHSTPEIGSKIGQDPSKGKTWKILLFFFIICLQKRLQRSKDPSQQTLQDSSHPSTRFASKQLLELRYINPTTETSTLQFQPPETSPKFHPLEVGSFTNASETEKYNP